MAMVEIKGLHRVRSGGSLYVYAWRGGPAIKARPIGSPAFMAEYNEAISNHRAPDASRLASVIVLYKASADFKGLAEATQRIWSRWLDRIRDELGQLSVQQFDRPEKIRPIIRQWRAKRANQPRTADYGMQVLSRVLSYAVDPLGKLASNPCEGISQLYKNNRADVIWTGEDIDALRGVASAEVMRAIDLAAATGLRWEDLRRLSWSHVDDDCIVISTSKSRFTRDAIIPLYDDLRALLKHLPRRSPVILTNSRDQPWRNINSSLAKPMSKAGLKGRLHLHDLRGTAATRFYLAGLSERVIGEMLGWEEDYVGKIIRRYVSRSAAVRATILQLNAARTGTDGVKSAVKSTGDQEG